MGAGRAPAHHVPIRLSDPRLLPGGDSAQCPGKLGLLLQHLVPEDPPGQVVPAPELRRVLQLETEPQFLRPGQKGRRAGQLQRAAGEVLLVGRLPTGVPVAGHREQSPGHRAMTTATETDTDIDADPQHTAQLRVERIERAAENINFVTLVDPDGAMLPAWDAGAHLELHLPSGLRRQYSLCGDPDDRYSYTVAVLRVDDGRGGSFEIHDTGLVGRTLEIRGPINKFGLVDASSYLLLAGGIGVTPIIAMARELHRRGATWRMVYGARSAAAMVLTAELSALPEHVSMMADDVEGIPDFASLIAAQPDGTAVYCCGPEPMLRAVEQICAATSSVTLHTERFSPSGKFAAPSACGEAPFDIELKRRGIVVHVGPDDNALDVVREVVRNHPYSCHEGMCGSCEVSVLNGKVDHRDDVLSDEERAANDVMMLCVSRALSDRLVIDL